MNTRILSGIFGGGCVKASPVFLRDIKKLQHIYSDSKQRFDPSLIVSGVRCSFGGLKVIICRPLSPKGRPFPTTFWLTCPYMIKRAGMIESNGGVNELEEYLESHNLQSEWNKYNLLHQLIRLRLIEKNTCSFTRKYKSKLFRSLLSGGIGGIKRTGNINVKCLHLQTASYIALGHHPGYIWLKSKGLFGECEEGVCSTQHQKIFMC